MKDLRVDERHVDMAGFIANNGTLAGERRGGFIAVTVMVCSRNVRTMWLFSQDALRSVTSAAITRV